MSWVAGGKPCAAPGEPEGRTNAAVNILAAQLEMMREEHETSVKSLEQQRCMVERQKLAMADVEVALRLLGVDPEVRST